MKIGDLVRFKHDYDSVGIVSDVDPNIHDSVTYKVWVSWNHMMNRITPVYSYQLEVINAQD
jgi:hypothetical protein